MTEIKNPSAFPMCDPEFNTVQVGMTLRDYFAAKAMLGYCSNADVLNPLIIAETSYKIADAMLEESSKP